MVRRWLRLAGSFPMGVPLGDRDGGRDEYPRHEVFVDTFFIDKFEVTNGLYLEFVKATDHRVPQNSKNPTRNLWQGNAIPDSLADRPVINVDWFDAEAYCTWAETAPDRSGMGESGKRHHRSAIPLGQCRANHETSQFQSTVDRREDPHARWKVRGRPRARSALTTWPAMYGNGSTTGTTLTTMRRALRKIP